MLVSFSRMNGICIVGYGYWGPKLVRNFLQTGGGIVAVCDENAERLGRARKDFPGLRTYSSFDALLAEIGRAHV